MLYFFNSEDSQNHAVLSSALVVVSPLPCGFLIRNHSVLSSFIQWHLLPTNRFLPAFSSVADPPADARRMSITFPTLNQMFRNSHQRVAFKPCFALCAQPPHSFGCPCRRSAFQGSNSKCFCKLRFLSIFAFRILYHRLTMTRRCLFHHCCSPRLSPPLDVVD